MSGRAAPLRPAGWTAEEEARLVADMAAGLASHQGRLDISRLADIMRAKDHYGNDQISSQQVDNSF